MVLVEDEVDVLRALNVCVRAEMGWSCAGEAARGLDGHLADALPGSSARRALGACDLGRDWQVSLIASDQTLKVNVRDRSGRCDWALKWVASGHDLECRGNCCGSR